MIHPIKGPPPLPAAVRLSAGVVGGTLAALLVAGLTNNALAQVYTDAVSREFTIEFVPYNGATDALSREFTVSLEDFEFDAISREFTLGPPGEPDTVSDTVAREFTLEFDPYEGAPNDAFTREITAFNGLAFLEVTSTHSAAAQPVVGSLAQQLVMLNAAPPAFDPNTWLPVQRQNLNVDDAFLCGSVPDPLARGYVSADTYLDAFGVVADEVTLDNCGSAFYRFTFNLPVNAVVSTATLSGSANVDDQGVVWLNGTRLSALLTAPTCNPANPSDPLDPCYLQQDAGTDREDADGVRVLTWPTLDPFEARQSAAFKAGENTLTFAVAGDAQAFEPTGVEFAAAVLYAKRGDVNCDGKVTFADIDPFVSALGGQAAYLGQFPYCRWLTADTNCDGAVTFKDIDPFVACLGGPCACP